jgi:predicted transcriptional regulator of viral defense system
LTVPGGVVCLISALSIYDLTEEIPRQFWIAIRHNTSYKGNSMVKVVRMRNLDLGKTKIKLGGMIISIFDKERTIVDAFRYLGRETAVKALKKAIMLEGADKIDLEKTRQYAKKLRVNQDSYILAVTV